MLRRVLALQASHTVEYGRGMNRVYSLRISGIDEDVEGEDLPAKVKNGLDGPWPREFSAN